jgi:two-component system sensor histidine kinase CssS
MTRPLVQMEARIAGIAERDWHEPFVLDRRDEIGRLASSFETMRQRLVRQDEAQQKFLQHVSHELKTPVMVIHSYTQSILDGIYPKGDLAGSVDVINEESQRLEKRIRDLLYLTKFNYLTGRPQLVSSFDLGGLVKERVERFRWRRSDLDWKLLLPQVKVNGDPEQWGVAVENVLDNQLRYASSLVDISLKAEGGKARLRLWNDGPEIDPDTMSRLFQQYQTGDGGEFGLGLSIVKQTASNHGARVWADNEEGGVAFYIEMEITKALT